MATDPVDDIEIPVWIGNQQKWITGLNRKTTCHDVIYLLLGYMNAEDEDIAKYAIYESWRGVERPLAGRTKLGKVWKAYGQDSENVVLTVRPFDLDTSCEVSHCKPRVSHRSHKYRSRTNLAGPCGGQYNLLPIPCTKPILPYKSGGLKERHANRDSQPDRYSSRTHLIDQRFTSGSCETMTRSEKLQKPTKPYKVTLPPKHKRSRTEGRESRESRNNIITSCHPGSAKSMQCLRHPQEVSCKYEDVYNRRSRTKESRERTSKSLPRDARHKRAKQEKKHKDKKIQKIFQIIVSQERKIKEQLEKLRSVDEQLAAQEAKRYEDMEQTLPELHDKDPNPELYPLIKSNDLEAYSHMCDNILKMQKKLTQEQDKIDEISMSIREETILEHSRLQVETLTESQIIGPKAGDFKNYDAKIQEELEALRSELDRASTIGKTQQSEIDSITKSIEDFDRQLAEKSHIVEKLMEELKELGDDEGMCGIRGEEIQDNGEDREGDNADREGDNVVGKRGNKVDNGQQNDQLKPQSDLAPQSSSDTSQKPGSLRENDTAAGQSIGQGIGQGISQGTAQGIGQSIQTAQAHQVSTSQGISDTGETVQCVGQSTTNEDMYTLTIVSDFNSTWDDDTFIVANDAVTQAIRDGKTFADRQNEDPKKSPTGESSASSGFSELSPTEEDNKARRKIANWCKKTFPFPSYDTMKNLRFDGGRKVSESESGNSSLEDQVTQETLV